LRQNICTAAFIEIQQDDKNKKPCRNQQVTATIQALAKRNRWWAWILSDVSGKFHDW